MIVAIARLRGSAAANEGVASLVHRIPEMFGALVESLLHATHAVPRVALEPACGFAQLAPRLLAGIGRHQQGHHRADRRPRDEAHGLWIAAALRHVARVGHRSALLQLT